MEVIFYRIGGKAQLLSDAFVGQAFFFAEGHDELLLGGKVVDQLVEYFVIMFIVDVSLDFGYLVKFGSG